MIHTYYHNQTEAYFSTQTLTNLSTNLDPTAPHPYFTILIINRLNTELMIDDYVFKNHNPSAIFISPGQHLFLTDKLDWEGYAISFNKDFYCIEYHDSEVSCNGLLFVNNFSLVQIILDNQQQAIYNNTVKEIESEFKNEDPLQAEMLKNLLKNLLIRSNRLFRMQHTIGNVDDSNIDFARKFSELVEKNFRMYKKVENYAQMMNLASASLTKKLQKYGVESPSKIIRDRIITEAKRLLIYTEKTVKEISNILGFDDQYYFSRLFSKEAGISPSDYKKQILKS